METSRDVTSSAQSTHVNKGVGDAQVWNLIVLIVTWYQVVRSLIQLRWETYEGWSWKCMLKNCLVCWLPVCERAVWLNDDCQLLSRTSTVELLTEEFIFSRHFLSGRCIVFNSNLVYKKLQLFWQQVWNSESVSDCAHITDMLACFTSVQFLNQILHAGWSFQ